MNKYFFILAGAENKYKDVTQYSEDIFELCV